MRLSIQQVAAREPDRPLWTLKHDEAKGSESCEHDRLRNIKNQTEEDQVAGAQPRIVWVRDPELPSAGAVGANDSQLHPVADGGGYAGEHRDSIAVRTT